MYFYRNPGWGIGFKILMIVLLIAGGTFIARSAFQAGLAQGAGFEAGEITAPLYHPHPKGLYFHPMGGAFLTVLALFFGGILLVKLITSIIGLVMFKRWKTEGGPEWEGWGPGWRGHHPHYPGPGHYKGWGPYPPKWKKSGEEVPEEPTEEEKES